MEDPITQGSLDRLRQAQVILEGGREAQKRLQDKNYSKNNPYNEDDPRRIFWEEGWISVIQNKSDLED